MIGVASTAPGYCLAAVLGQVEAIGGTRLRARRGRDQRALGADGGRGRPGQLIIKEAGENVELLTRAPKTGVYTVDDEGRLSFSRWANDRHDLVGGSEAFFLRVAAPGDYRHKGADLGRAGGCRPTTTS